MKRCGHCGIRKLMSDFYKLTKSADGHSSWCKACRDECTRQWRKDNPECIKAINRKWRQNHPEAMRDYMRRRRAVEKALGE